MGDSVDTDIALNEIELVLGYNLVQAALCDSDSLRGTLLCIVFSTNRIASPIHLPLSNVPMPTHGTLME